MITRSESSPRWTIVLPTYRRGDVLQQCLQHLVNAIGNSNRFEVLVYDNGAPETSRSVVEAFKTLLPLRYRENESGHGLGYSLRRGAEAAKGDYVLELNDDAMVPPDLFEQIESRFRSDPTIGIIGVRAIENEYVTTEGDVGTIDPSSMRVVGNFVTETTGPIDVEHVYGFCYAYRRDVLLRGGGHDHVLLAKDYSSGNRIETDQCLTAKRLGYRVVYDGSITVTHLAKPRGDISEASLRWRVNDVRNTLYLYLKHFGPFGRNAIALRYAALHDVGIRSALLHPSSKTMGYFWAGVRARGSAFWHWLIFLYSRPPLKPLESMQEVSH